MFDYKTNLSVLRYSVGPQSSYQAVSQPLGSPAGSDLGHIPGKILGLIKNLVPLSLLVSYNA